MLWRDSQSRQFCRRIRQHGTGSVALIAAVNQDSARCHGPAGGCGARSLRCLIRITHSDAPARRDQRDLSQVVVARYDAAAFGSTRLDQSIDLVGIGALGF
jgi:hypothetical protein